MDPEARAAGLLAPLAARVRRGEARAVDLVAEAFRRIEAAGDLNAVVCLDRRAADAAARLDAAVAGGHDPGPLAGLPVLVKDIEDAAGLPTTFGSLLEADAPPATADGLVAGRLRAAGAIVVGKTNVPEFAFEGYTANRVFGPTGNPWAPGRSPGGSSGGSGAALAAGLIPIATATDVGGSIRIPAALCGLVGLKPTAGMIGPDPILVSPALNTHGPLAATIADARLLLAVLANPPPDGAVTTPPVGRPAETPTRLLCTARLAAGPPPAPALLARFDDAVARLADALGLAVERIGPAAIFPGGYDADDWFRIVGLEQALALGRQVIERDGDRLDAVVRAALVAALEIRPADHAAAHRRRRRYAAELDALLAGGAVLVSPTLNVDGWAADGRLEPSTPPGLPGWVFNTEPPNLTGHPAIALPAGRAEDGLPFGVQIVGPRHRETTLLDIGAVWEAASPWPLTAPGFAPFGLRSGGRAESGGPDR